MYKNILVPMALDHGVSAETLALAKSMLAPDGTITALHVYEMPNGSVSAYIDEGLLDAGYERAKAEMTKKLEGFSGIKAVLQKGHTSRTIIEYAEAAGIDCIVIASHKPGFRDYLLGSTAARVVRHAGCSVHVKR